MSLSRQEMFEYKYNELFGERPHGLSILAYDAVQMASDLSRVNQRNLPAAITRGEGFNGISGVFRIFVSGQNEHGLDIVKVTSGGEQLVDAAPQEFYGIGNAGGSGYGYGYGYTMPQIYGKSAAELQMLLNNMQ